MPRPRARASQPPEDLPEIIVQRSSRRTKTVNAHFSGDAVVLAVPQRATRAQIAHWSAMDDPQRLAVWARVEQRIHDTETHRP